MIIGFDAIFKYICCSLI